MKGRRRVWQTTLSLAAVWSFCAAFQSEPTSPQQLLRKAVDAARAQAAAIPNYTCLRTIRRQKCIRPTSKSVSQCGKCPGYPSLALSRTDQVRVEVGVTENGEMFSWPGEEQFRTRDLEALLGGGTITVGEFGSFPISVFLSDSDPASFRLEQGAFLFDVPPHTSHFAIRGRGGHDYVTGYHGKAQVDSRSGALHRLDILVDHPPEESGLTRVVMSIEYEGAIPKRSRVEVIGTDGDIALNETEFSACRTFSAQSTLLFEASIVPEPQSTSPLGLNPLPASEIRVSLNTPIDSATDYVGRRIEGRLLTVIRDSTRRVIVPADTILRGRIARLERFHCPVSNFVLGLVFDEVVVGGAGATIKLAAPPFRWRTRGSSEPEMALLPEEDRHGVQNFVFRRRDSLRISRGFVSNWRIDQ